VPRSSTVNRAAAVLAAAVLAVLAGGYYLTYEPAPSIDIRWRDGVSLERRAAVERRFRLVRPHDEEGRTVSYDLLDTSPGNIKSLLEQPEVEDSGRFDLRTHTVRPDAPYGTSWIWVGNRLPLLRIPGVTPAIAAACGGVLAFVLIRRALARPRV
jgi:hypothetical protein